MAKSGKFLDIGFFANLHRNYEWLLKDVLFRKFLEKSFPTDGTFDWTKHVEMSPALRSALENYGILSEMLMEMSRE